MKLIIGLGNPGPKYENTRHNAGFKVLDALVLDLCLEFKPNKKMRSEIAKDDNLILAKPQTFMNGSGEAVSAIKNFLKIPDENILIVQDEIDLPFGQIRLSKNSASAGHKGIASIIEKIGNNFSRLRVGIENRKQARVPETDAYVLQDFSPDEEEELKKNIIPKAMQEIKNILAPTTQA